MSAFRIEVRAFDHPDVTGLIDAVQALYAELYGNHDNDYTDPAEFAPPSGLFLVGYLDGVPVASGGWRRRGDDTAEIKRMFVADAARGQGLARKMLAELEASAAAAGIREIVLNTGYAQTAAIALYESSGYARTERRYGHYAQQKGAFFYAKPIGVSPQS
jgi:ribosomal protein S18 acetylase RimI-like enzyme